MLELYLPELFLLCASLLLLMVHVILKPSLGTLAWGAFAIVTGGIAVIWLSDSSGILSPAILSLKQDVFAHSLQTGILAAVGITAILSLPWLSALQASVGTVPETEKYLNHTGEYFILMLLAALGMCVMVSANDFLMLYIGLEMQSLALYVLAAFHRDKSTSSEAALKYFVLGALASGIMLYGISLLYGGSGSILFVDAITNIDNPLSIVAMLFVLCGVLFKISIVPFHMWTPDVYQGSPTPVTTFFAVAPKIAAFGLLIRLLSEPFLLAKAEWQMVLTVLSILTMIVGALAAIQQDNIKRLLAYSSIGHMGYALVGLAAFNSASSIFYLMVYAITSLGAFSCVLSMQQQGKPVENIDALSGLVKHNPFLAYSLGALMMSMAGIPIFAGFLSKFYIFKVAVDANMITLAVVGVLTSVIACYYYLRICKIMFFDAPLEGGNMDALPNNFSGKFIGYVIGVSAIFSVVFMIFPAPLFWELASIITSSIAF